MAKSATSIGLDTDPPSDWTTLLRETRGVRFIQVHYRRGGRAPGYRDLQGRRAFDPDELDVMDADGQPIDSDPAGVAAEQAWRRAMSHWEQLLEDDGVKRCFYKLSVLDDGGRLLAETDPVVARRQTDDDSADLEAELGQRVAGWDKLTKAQLEHSKHVSKLYAEEKGASVDVIKACAELIREIRNDVGDGGEAGPSEAEWGARAMISMERIKEAGASFRHFTDRAAPLFREAWSEFQAAKGGPQHSAPDAVLDELVRVGAPASAVRAASRGDREAARLEDVPDTATLFWQWAGEGQD